MYNTTQYSAAMDEEKAVSLPPSSSPSTNPSTYHAPHAHGHTHAGDGQEGTHPSDGAAAPVVPAPGIGAPPDGGAQAWMCVAGAFLMQFVQFGLSESPCS